MNRYIKICLLGLVLAFSSCGESFLEVEPEQSLSISTAITDLTSFNAALLGVYSNYQDANLYGWDFPLIPEIRGDNVYISSQNAGRFLSFDDFNTTDLCGRCEGEWLDNYEVVVNASNIINLHSSIEFLSTEEAEAGGRLGEAHALRALSYWNLLRFFAKPYNVDNGASMGIAINNEGTTGEIISPSRGTVADGYAQVISDLQTAISLIETTADGRISKAAAQALLAKVYLYQEDWVNAESMATEVINNSDYSLYASGADWLSSWGANVGSEDLFVVINTAADNLGVNSLGGIYDQDGYGDILATRDLYDAFSDSDARKSVMRIGNRPSGEENAVIPEGKYPNGETGLDYVKVIRLADVYLIRAEARAEQGNEDGARSDLDAVASRVISDYTPSTAAGQDLLDAILKERRLELAFEGDRAFDLMRKKKSWTKFRTTDSQQVNFDDNQLIHPIPRSEIDINPNMQQNPGY